MGIICFLACRPIQHPAHPIWRYAEVLSGGHGPPGPALHPLQAHGRGGSHLRPLPIGASERMAASTRVPTTVVFFFFFLLGGGRQYLGFWTWETAFCWTALEILDMGIGLLGQRLDMGHGSCCFFFVFFFFGGGGAGVWLDFYRLTCIYCLVQGRLKPRAFPHPLEICRWVCFVSLFVCFFFFLGGTKQGHPQKETRPHTHMDETQPFGCQCGLIYRFWRRLRTSKALCWK